MCEGLIKISFSSYLIQMYVIRVVLLFIVCFCECFFFLSYSSWIQFHRCRRYRVNINTINCLFTSNAGWNWITPGYSFYTTSFTLCGFSPLSAFSNSYWCCFVYHRVDISFVRLLEVINVRLYAFSGTVMHRISFIRCFSLSREVFFR